MGSGAPPRLWWFGALKAFVLSGTSALVYQVLWVRLLGLLFGTSAFSITTVLSVFFGGLALGSGLVGRR
ncbi:MAG: hypothetical protein COW34_12645, partial [Armatimonadetes bacterium CG17_big_fil_post_rev_8_21_14_2_50_66_6]